VTSNSERRTLPVVTYTLIGLNVLMFLVELGGGDQFIDDWAFIPAKFAANPGANAITIFSAMFMHGGWFHLFGNMLIPMDLRGQCRRPVRPSQIPDLLFAGWDRRDLGAVCLRSSFKRAGRHRSRHVDRSPAREQRRIDRQY